MKMHLDRPVAISDEQRAELEQRRRTYDAYTDDIRARAGLSLGSRATLDAQPTIKTSEGYEVHENPQVNQIMHAVTTGKISQSDADKALRLLD